MKMKHFFAPEPDREHTGLDNRPGPDVVSVELQRRATVSHDRSGDSRESWTCSCKPGLQRL